MKKLLLAAGAIGAMLLTASPAAAQRYHRGHSSISVSIGTGYGYSPYGYGYAGYGYDPYDYGYYDQGYAYPSYSYYRGRGGYYDRYDDRNWRDRRHRHDRDATIIAATATMTTVKELVARRRLGRRLHRPNDARSSSIEA